MMALKCHKILWIVLDMGSEAHAASGTEFLILSLKSAKNDTSHNLQCEWHPPPSPTAAKMVAKSSAAVAYVRKNPPWVRIQWSRCVTCHF
jgi:hypothetical protein